MPDVYPTIRPIKEPKTHSRIYIVRMQENRDLVGIFTGRRIEDITDAIDEIADPYRCEYAATSYLAIGWPAPVCAVPSNDDDPEPKPDHRFIWPGRMHDVLDKLKWRPIVGTHVYFIRCGGLVKIGVAMDPKKRLRELQLAANDKLTLLRTIWGGYSDEKEYHDRFADYRSHREWFRIEGDLADFLGIEGTTA